MPDPPSQAPMNYPNAPPPPENAPAGYPPQQYPGWQGPPPQQYRPMLPAWLSFGGILVLVGGVLVLVGFLVGAIADSTFASSGATNAAQTYFNTMAIFDALVGIGIFLAFLGWLFHQMSRHHQMGH
jgi:hypothetical protein